MDHVNVGDAANASGVSAKLIRYYESIDLIPEAGCTKSGYRVYTESEVQTLRFIKRARGLGFSIKQIGQLLALWHDRSRTSAQVRTVALAHAEELETKILELRAMASTLHKIAASCQNDERPNCPILDDLAEAKVSSRVDDSAKKGKPAVRRPFGPAGSLRGGNGGSGASPAMRTGRG
jgi:MerR family transcriptional regulator, copper efflux regulator